MTNARDRAQVLKAANKMAFVGNVILSYSEGSGCVFRAMPDASEYLSMTAPSILLGALSLENLARQRLDFRPIIEQRRVHGRCNRRGSSLDRIPHRRRRHRQQRVELHRQ